jgi:hypothetical protein
MVIHELFLAKIRASPLHGKREISVSINDDHIRVTLDDGWICGIGIKQVLEMADERVYAHEIDTEIEIEGDMIIVCVRVKWCPKA